jgi:hypothetical protein
MEHQLWDAILAVLGKIDKPRQAANVVYTDEQIVKVWMWAVLHDRPVCWASEPANWPLHERRWKKPSSSRMSRRLRAAGVQSLLRQVEQHVLTPRGQSLGVGH